MTMQSAFWLAFGLLWVLVAIQGFAFLELVRQVADLRQGTEAQGPRLLSDAIPVGSPLPNPPVSLRSMQTREPISWAQVLGDAATALVFLHPSCATCYTVASDLRRVMNVQDTGVKIVPVLTARSPERALEFVQSTKLPTEFGLVDEDGEGLAKALSLNRKPAVVAIRGSKIAAVATVVKGDHIKMLLDDVLKEPQELQTLTGKN